MITNQFLSDFRNCVIRIQSFSSKFCCCWAGLVSFWDLQALQLFCKPGPRKVSTLYLLSFWITAAADVYRYQFFIYPANASLSLIKVY